MRPRLTLAFGLLAVLVVVAFVAFRTVTISDLAQQHLREDAEREAMVLAAAVVDGSAEDMVRPPSTEVLTPYADPDRMVTVTLPDGRTSQATGLQWDQADATDAVIGTATSGGVTVEVHAPRREVDREVAAAVPSLLGLGAVLVLFAIVLGAVVARRLSKPFVELAEAANALARGRLDLRLPRTRIGEARAIGVALEGAADQFGQSLRRERDLALRASHELRTPLTALRLELHDLADRDDVQPDLIEAAERAAAYIDRLDHAVGDVLEETRRHPVVSTAQLPLGLVVGAVARRWSDTLALTGVTMEAELLGDPALHVTPGPLEQLLDEVLLEVLAHRGRRTHLVVDGGERHLRVTVTVDGAAVADPSAGSSGPLDRARTVIETVGGRVSGSLASPTGLVVVIPRR